MRRLFVILLFLLLPLDALAHTWPASFEGLAGEREHANPPSSVVSDAAPACADEGGPACEPDTDEAAGAGADIHDALNTEAPARMAFQPGGCAAPYVPPRHCPPSFPPLKPPPLP